MRKPPSVGVLVFALSVLPARAFSQTASAPSTGAFPVSPASSAPAAAGAPAPDAPQTSTGGAPSTGYGGTAPPASYGAPPPQSGYGTQPPPNGYGTQPPQYGYAGAPPPAYGYPPPPPPVDEPPKHRSVSITLSPLHLIEPFLEITVELRPVDHLGLALIGGFGQVRPLKKSEDTTETSFSARDVGGQVAWYPLHAFDSLMLGAELLWVDVSAKNDVYAARAAGGGLAVGPLIGYKWIAEGGFTLFVQGGASHISSHAEGSASDGTTMQVDDDRWIPNLNFNLGWSF